MTEQQFENATVAAKANVYFNGDVVSHSIQFASGEKKTLGIIRPGEYHFSTAAPENMAITDGVCRVKLAGSENWTGYSSGQSFDIGGDSSFDIAVDEGLCQYICSFG